MYPSPSTKSAAQVACKIRQILRASGHYGFAVQRCGRTAIKVSWKFARHQPYCQTLAATMLVAARLVLANHGYQINQEGFLECEDK